MRKLEKDLESQEMLLQGLNKENQKMAEEAKQAKLEHEETQRRMFEEHERLNKVINNLTQQLQLGDTATSAHKRAMELEKQLNKDVEIGKLTCSLSPAREYRIVTRLSAVVSGAMNQK